MAQPPKSVDGLRTSRNGSPLSRSAKPASRNGAGNGHSVRLSTVSQRLEAVRTRSRLSTLRDFWRALTEDGTFKISYEAVRNYHADRDPPVEYLVRVSDQFAVSLPWLATGRGHPWPGDPDIARASKAAKAAPREEFEQALREVFAQFTTLPSLAAATALETCDRLHRDAEFRSRLSGRTPPTRSYVGRFVGKALAGPLVNAVAGSVRSSELHPWQVESYVSGICQALTALIPNPNWAQVVPRTEVH